MPESQHAVTLLDGGTGRELARIGAPFRQPEWSALALIEAPEYVLKCHENYIAAGADVITSNSYALVPFHLGAVRFTRDGKRLAALAGRLALDAKQQAKRSVQVAGSLPPVMGSYRPDLFDRTQAKAILSVLIDALKPSVDLWLGETLSAVAEADLLLELLHADARPKWVSFTLDDRSDPNAPTLRSGEPVVVLYDLIHKHSINALLFNCSQPEIMAGALRQLRTQPLPSALRLGVYANAFPAQNGEEAANEHLHDIRADLTPQRYLEFAQQWVTLGASIIGGCCGIGPEHIEQLRQHWP